MKRRRYSNRELDELQTLKLENKKLKRQISFLRKQLKKIDIDRYFNLKELIDKQQHEDEQVVKRATQRELQKRWKCWDCEEGYLRITILNRRDGVFYYRFCSECGKRTKIQEQHTKLLEGPQ